PVYGRTEVADGVVGVAVAEGRDLPRDWGAFRYGETVGGPRFQSDIGRTGDGTGLAEIRDILQDADVDELCSAIGVGVGAFDGERTVRARYRTGIETRPVAPVDFGDEIGGDVRRVGIAESCHRHIGEWLVRRAADRLAGQGRSRVRDGDRAG